MQNESILSTMISGSDSSLGATGTTPGGLHFVYSIDSLGSGGLEKLTGLYAIGLPFASTTHLLAIPKGKETLLNLSEMISSMQPVTLEGDYDSYFSLYANQGQQVESRVLLDPAAMEFSIDFCAAYTWEIIDNSLYFMSESILPDLKIIDDFVTQLTPAEVIKTTITLNQKPQSVERLMPTASTFQCPICHMKLLKGKRWLACTNGHGYLLTAEELILTRQHMNDTQRAVEASVGSAPNVITSVTTVDHGDIVCPNDTQTMIKAGYQETTAFLYSCPSCIYRWIDGQYLDIILGKYRNDGDDDKDDGGDSDSGLESFNETMMRGVDVSHRGFGRTFN
jgi:hypothetical protein